MYEWKPGDLAGEVCGGYGWRTFGGDVGLGVVVSIL